MLTKSNHSDSDFEERPINTLQIENSQSTFNSLTAHLVKETQAKISDFDDHTQMSRKTFEMIVYSERNRWDVGLVVVGPVFAKIGSKKTLLVLFLVRRLLLSTII